MIDGPSLASYAAGQIGKVVAAAVVVAILVGVLVGWLL